MWGSRSGITAWGANFRAGLNGVGIQGIEVIKVTTMLHRVKDLSPEQRHAAELLLGRTVSEDEAVRIKSLGLFTVTPSRLAPEARVEALKAPNERLANPNGSEADA